MFFQDGFVKRGFSSKPTPCAVPRRPRLTLEERGETNLDARVVGGGLEGHLVQLGNGFY